MKRNVKRFLKYLYDFSFQRQLEISLYNYFLNSIANLIALTEMLKGETTEKKNKKVL